jgi:hypothetical protein
MANTYVPIATTTVGSGGTTTIEFASIPQTYTDLKIVVSARMDRAVTRQSLNVWFNNSTGSWTGRRLAGYDSSSVLSDVASTTYYQIPQGTGTSATASTFSNSEYYIPNYTSSNNKSILSDSVTENNSITAWISDLGAGLWSNTAAITSIKIDGNGYNFLQYSTITLYGIKKN